jgi:NSS family neurotransmitter:Na+ symporter
VAGGLPTSAVAAQERFDALVGSLPREALFHGIFIALSAAIVARGVNGGIELACRVLMPLLAVLIVLLAVYGIAAGDAAAALRFLFRFESERFSARAALEALGLGFFSIGVGFGAMITYAAYADRDISLSKVALVSVAFDTAISLAAGFAVFPIVFANGLDPAGGPGLVFTTLPLAFARMPFGTIAAVAFFALLFIAALASAISMLEIVVAWLTRRLGWSRVRASLLAGAAAFVGGLGTVFSLDVLERLDHLTSNVLLPVGAFGLALFTGWALPARLLEEELGLSRGAIASLRVLLRYVAPAGIAAAALPALFG